MPEAVLRDLVVGADDEELGIDRLVEGHPHLGVGQAAHLGEDLVVDHSARDRGDLDKPARAFRRRGQMHQQHTAQRLGKPLATLAGLVDGGDQLLGEERVAVGPAGDRIDQRLRRASRR